MIVFLWMASSSSVSVLDCPAYRERSRRSWNPSAAGLPWGGLGDLVSRLDFGTSPGRWGRAAGRGARPGSSAKTALGALPRSGLPGHRHAGDRRDHHRVGCEERGIAWLLRRQIPFSGIPRPGAHGDEVNLQRTRLVPSDLSGQIGVSPVIFSSIFVKLCYARSSSWSCCC